ncbi:MAG: hypothetical protein RIA09_15855 [Hoeflea sp.]|uniref:hypothetical protein n=1 Tax=Hoeflea sp. TaxID=1940281 RepID=UPI0032EC7C35
MSVFMDIWHDMVGIFIIGLVVLSVLSKPYVVMTVSIILVMLIVLVAVVTAVFQRKVQKGYEDAKLQLDLDGDQTGFRD